MTLIFLKIFKILNIFILILGRVLILNLKFLKFLKSLKA